MPDSGGNPGMEAPGSAAGLFTCASRNPRACTQPALCEIGRWSSKPPASEEPSVRPNSNGPNSPTPLGSTANVPLPVVAPVAPIVPRAWNPSCGGASISAVATTPASGASTSAYGMDAPGPRALSRNAKSFPASLNSARPPSTTSAAP